MIHQMELKSLEENPKIVNSPKALKQFQKLEKLLSELSQKTLTASVVNDINQEIDKINHTQKEDKAYLKELRTSYNHILKILRIELKLLPKHYYRNMWFVVGMTSLGLPIGVGFGLALDNMAFLGIGLPIGMTLGMAIGSGMDNKAKKEGKQLDVEL